MAAPLGRWAAWELGDALLWCRRMFEWCHAAGWVAGAVSAAAAVMNEQGPANRMESARRVSKREGSTGWVAKLNRAAERRATRPSSGASGHTTWRRQDVQKTEFRGAPIDCGPAPWAWLRDRTLRSSSVSSTPHLFNGTS